ncbi:MAG TPA: hypothetical protein DCM14_02630 [Clostridiales bacterium UBA8153]|nr:hypothetical protein [Clostridiales bacterium UBA8153]
MAYLGQACISRVHGKAVRQEEGNGPGWQGLQSHSTGASGYCGQPGERRRQGVLHADSFDELQLVLDTELGSLSTGGEDLHECELNLETGLLLLEGMITSLTYSAATKGKKAQGGGFLGRLFR